MADFKLQALRANVVQFLDLFLVLHTCIKCLAACPEYPVSLSCNHSFCSSCLQEFWGKTGNKNCPICKRRSSK
uniref:RING-type domain-containing protein n=1 Tax=Xiphophorus couchianus TaxID=32473 RepID=A0A3B5LNW4_9TELE